MKVFLMVLVILGAQSSFAANDCFNSSFVRNFNVVNDRMVEVDAGSARYTVEVMTCPDMMWAHRIAFRSFSGASKVCSGDDLIVLDNFSNQPQAVCHIFNVTKI